MPETKKIERTNQDKFLNVPEKLEIQGLGEVEFRDLTLEQLSSIIPDLALVIEAANQASKNKELTIPQLVTIVLAQPVLIDALRSVVSKMTNRDANDFKDLNLRTWGEILVVVKKVLDFDELYKLFMVLVENAENKNSEKLPDQNRSS